MMMMIIRYDKADCTAIFCTGMFTTKLCFSFPQRKKLDIASSIISKSNTTFMASAENIQTINISSTFLILACPHYTLWQRTNENDRDHLIGKSNLKFKGQPKVIIELQKPVETTCMSCRKRALYINL